MYQSAGSQKEIKLDKINQEMKIKRAEMFDELWGQHNAWDHSHLNLLLRSDLTPEFTKLLLFNHTTD